MYKRFVETAKPSPSDRVLDVGVTPDDSLQESNYFEKHYPYVTQITATSIEDAVILEDRFPGVTFVRTQGVLLPFPDKQFDIAFCSAVIEHVGDEGPQRTLVSELLRVSRAIYILTPNRWYPIDFHTMLPILHWLPRQQHQRLLRWLGRDFWSKTENLNLLSLRRLRSLFPADVDVHTDVHRTLGLPSNLIAYVAGSHQGRSWPG
jgi:hypothetical protein